MLKIGILVGSTRPGRHADAVAQWVKDVADLRGDAEYEIVDLADYPLPHLDEAFPASMQQYANDHTKQWSAKIAEFDGYIFVTPEYNHSTSGVLKNAIDYLNVEWNNKAAGIVSYGSVGGARAAEHLRLILGELQVADVRQQVTMSIFTDFENFGAFTPADSHEAALSVQLDQLTSWAGALRTVRVAEVAA
jgi:NAD(P)H-dependent FMN reductase